MKHIGILFDIGLLVMGAYQAGWVILKTWGI